MFVDRLVESIKSKKNPSVVGLDPRIEGIPGYMLEKAYREFGKNLKGVSMAVYWFNCGLIDGLRDIIPAVKPQMAFYECLGVDGIDVFHKTVKYARDKGLLVICDGKRNDIGSTANAYSKAFLGMADLGENEKTPVFDVDALTISPYLGYDGIKPFIEDCRSYGKGIFILDKTSNKSSGDFQDLCTYNGKSIYEIVAEKINEWGESLMGQCGYSSIGAVVGATYPNQAKILRRIMRNSYILVPGYGAQGGNGDDVVPSFNSDGLGAVVNASRSIIFAYKNSIYADKYDEADYVCAAREEALKMRDDINRALEKKFG